jgi:hypothetical protein
MQNKQFDVADSVYQMLALMLLNSCEVWVMPHVQLWHLQTALLLAMEKCRPHSRLIQRSVIPSVLPHL